MAHSVFAVKGVQSSTSGDVELHEPAGRQKKVLAAKPQRVRTDQNAALQQDHAAHPVYCFYIRCCFEHTSSGSAPITFPPPGINPHSIIPQASRHLLLPPLSLPHVFIPSSHTFTHRRSDSLTGSHTCLGCVQVLGRARHGHHSDLVMLQGGNNLVFKEPGLVAV